MQKTSEGRLQKKAMPTGKHKKRKVRKDALKRIVCESGSLKRREKKVDRPPEDLPVEGAAIGSRAGYRRWVALSSTISREKIIGEVVQ